MTQSSSNNALLSAWSATLARLADTPAIFYADGSVVRTFRDIEKESGSLASQLASLIPGSIVGVQIGNSATWPAVLLALFRAGIVVLPLGRHMDSGELELALETCGVASLLTSEGDEIRISARVAGPAPDWNGLAPDLLKLTSGTTSAPRAVRFRAHQLLADAENICATMGITEGDVNFGVIPFSHSYGFSNLLTPLLAFGVPLVASEDRMPRAILHGLATTGATVFPGMPVFFQKLAELENTAALPSLRLCISAGAPLPRSAAVRFREKFHLRIHTFYGASECGGIAYDDAGFGGDDGFVGTPMRGVRITRSYGAELAPIEVRSAAVGDGYFPASAEPLGIETAEALSFERFIPTDLIRWSGEEMCIAGRASDVINVAGRKLNPIEIEGQIGSHPAVLQAVVFGIPSSLRGEEPVACIVALPGTNATEILRHCHARLSAWQTPKDIWLLDEIPTNERGKISRHRLAELYLASRG